MWESTELVASSQLIYPEARAALAAARRGRRIETDAHEVAITTLEEIYAQLLIIGIDEPLARHAGDLATEHALRGYDAVHLACAFALDADDILVATWDIALSDAALRAGLLTLDPRM